MVKMPNENVNVLQTLIQFRRGTEEQWNLVKDSYIPRAGEPCVTLDGKYKGQVKIGDGALTWGQLKYIGVIDGTGGIPEASVDTAGIVKLYDGLGNNVDGTISQLAITQEINKKVEMNVDAEKETITFGYDLENRV